VFAPNRMLTTKEQWLFVGLTVAIITGCATLYFHDGINAKTNENAAVIIPVRQPAITTADTEDVSTSAPSVAVSASTQPPAPSPAETPEQQPTSIGVAVMGAVTHPGFYIVEKDLRVTDLIAIAGGATDHADLSDILLTAPLIDETTLTIPEMPLVKRDEKQVAMRRRGTSVVYNPPGYRRSAPLFSPAPPQQGAPHISSPEEAMASPGTTAPGGLINVNHATAEQLQSLPGIGPVFAERIIEERSRQPFMSVEELTRVPGIAEKRLEAIRPFVTAP